MIIKDEINFKKEIDFENVIICGIDKFESIFTVDCDNLVRYLFGIEYDTRFNENFYNDCKIVKFADSEEEAFEYLKDIISEYK